LKEDADIKPARCQNSTLIEIPRWGDHWHLGVLR
jgi:hypothetical protein